jgi:broad specificity phosphatase PhoE
MEGQVMELPRSLIDDLAVIPRDRPVTLLMRHSARYPINDPAETYLVGLTPEGVVMAEALGAVLGQMYPGGRLLSAPVGRCQDTAQAIARGAGWPGQAQPDERLSHPFIAPAWDCYNRGEVNGRLPRQVQAVLALLLEHEGSAPRLDVLVTHDTIVGTLAGCLLKAPVLKEHWPGFLEGVFVWRSEGRVCARWRGTDWQFGEAEILAGSIFES